MNTTLVALLLFDGGLHLFLAPAHLTAWPLLGASFLACGIVQCALATLVLDGRRGPLAGGIVGVSAVALLAYLLAVTSGLPLAPAAHSGAESVTLLGLVSKLAELATLGLASIGTRRRLGSSAFA